jgi:hypothetical protein
MASVVHDAILFPGDVLSLMAPWKGDDIPTRTDADVPRNDQPIKSVGAPVCGWAVRDGVLVESVVSSVHEGLKSCFSMVDAAGNTGKISRYLDESTFLFSLMLW